MTLKSRILALHAALFAILLAVSPAESGSMTLLGVGKVGGVVVGPPIFTNQNDDGSWSGAGTATVTSQTQSIGAASAARRVVVMVRTGDTGNTLSSGTIGGVPIDTNIPIGHDGTGAIWLVSAIVPLGTTAATALTFSGSVFGGPFSTTFTVDNSQLVSSTPVTNSAAQASGTTVTGTVAVLAGGSILAICAGSGVSTNPQITASTASLSNDGTIGNFYSSGHANGAAANVASSVTETWTGTGSAILGLAAYR